MTSRRSRSPPSGTARMPEGHTLRRLANELSAAFLGSPVRVSSPQGRFTADAALIDGQPVLGADSAGKHLFVEFPGERFIHIHLGLIGKFDVLPGPAPAPVGQVRLRLQSETAYADLRGAILCNLIGREKHDQVIGALGADPLRPDADPMTAWKRISRSHRPIGDLLMDQAVLAGIGNVYRAEVLFRHRIDPLRPGNTLRVGQFRAMWADLVELMQEGVRTGRIDTVRMMMHSLIAEERGDAVAEAMRAAFGAGATIDELEALKGGMSGAAVLRLRTGGRDHLLRLERPDRQPVEVARHLSCLGVAAQAGVAPAVRYADAASGVAITAFIEAQPLSTYAGGREAMLAELAGLVRALQATQPFAPGPAHLDAADGFIADFRATAFLAEEAIGEHLLRFSQIRAVWRTDRAAVSSHNDLNPGNILYDGRRLWLTDWEVAAASDPFGDLSCLAHSMNADEAQEGLLLGAWLGRPANEEEVRQAVRPAPGVADGPGDADLKDGGRAAARPGQPLAGAAGALAGPGDGRHRRGAGGYQ